MTVFPDDRGLTPVKELDAPAFAGTLPDWIVDASDGGSVEALDAGHDGGYWRLSPDGGEARLETAFPLDPAAYDVVEVSSRLRATGDDVSALIGFENAEESLVYGFEADGRPIDDRVRAERADVVAAFDARRIDGSREHEVLLRWDVDEELVELHLDGGVAAIGSIDHLAAEAGVSPFWRVTGTDAEFRVVRATIRYRARHNSV